MNFVNLTPHPVRLRRNAANKAAEADAGDMVLPSSGSCRVSANPGEKLGEAESVALYARTAYGEIYGLPSPAPDTLYIVSVMLVGRVLEREDCFIPGTGPKDGAIRNSEGQIFAVTRLVQA
ncbi:MAG: hypothetical protein AAB518_02305 [Patescibacteria group bacterium]